jgi:hypothetical protein
MNDRPHLEWWKSSFSGSNGNCVEVALLDDGGVALRDSKDGGTGPVLRYTAAEWRAFVAGVEAGEFTRS